MPRYATFQAFEHAQPVIVDLDRIETVYIYDDTRVVARLLTGQTVTLFRGDADHSELVNEWFLKAETMLGSVNARSWDKPSPSSFDALFVKAKLNEAAGG